MLQTGLLCPVPYLPLEPLVGPARLHHLLVDLLPHAGDAEEQSGEGVAKGARQGACDEPSFLLVHSEK